MTKLQELEQRVEELEADAGLLFDQTSLTANMLLALCVRLKIEPRELEADARALIRAKVDGKL